MFSPSVQESLGLKRRRSILTGKTKEIRTRSASPHIIWPKKTINPPVSSPPYPPIIVDHLPNWAEHFRELKALLGRPLNAIPFGTGIKFKPSDEQEYNSIQEIIKKESSMLPPCFNLRVAIRGLFINTELSQIRKALTEAGFNVKRVLQGTRSGKRRLYLVELKRTTGLTSPIYDIKKLLLRTVKIEPNMGLYGYKYNTYPCHQMLWNNGNKSRKFDSPQIELNRIENSNLGDLNKKSLATNVTPKKSKKEVIAIHKPESLIATSLQTNINPKKSKKEVILIHKPGPLEAQMVTQDMESTTIDSTIVSSEPNTDSPSTPIPAYTNSNMETVIHAVNHMVVSIRGGARPETAALDTIMKFADRNP